MLGSVIPATATAMNLTKNLLDKLS